MNKKIYLIEYTIIVFILTLFNRDHSIENLLISFAIVIIQYFFDRLRFKYMQKRSQ